MKEARPGRMTLQASTSVRSLGAWNAQRQTDSRRVGTGGWREEVGESVSVWQDENVLEMHGAHGDTRCILMPLSCALKNASEGKLCVMCMLLKLKKF